MASSGLRGTEMSGIGNQTDFMPAARTAWRSPGMLARIIPNSSSSVTSTRVS